MGSDDRCPLCNEPYNNCDGHQPEFWIEAVNDARAEALALRAQVEALTRERDEARVERDNANLKASHLHRSEAHTVALMTSEVNRVKAARDTLARRLEAVEKVCLHYMGQATNNGYAESVARDALSSCRGEE